MGAAIIVLATLSSSVSDVAEFLPLSPLQLAEAALAGGVVYAIRDWVGSLPTLC